MSDPNLVILAGGISSRMRAAPASAAEVDPTLLREASSGGAKSLLGVGDGGRPLLDYLLYNAREAGYRDVVIVTGENDAAFRLHYGAADKANPFHGLSISYAAQRIPEGRTKPLGTADALLHALRARPDWRGTKFTVCNSDNLYSINALRILLDDERPAAMIEYDRDALRFDATRISQFAVIRRNGDYLAAIVEKPAAGVVEASRVRDGHVGVSMNIFRFSYDVVLPVLEKVPLHPVRQEKDLPQAIMLMVAADRHAMAVIPLAEEVPDLTSQNDISRVQEYVRAEFPKFSFDRR